MRSNRLPVLNRFKMDSNWLLIEIFNPKLSPDSIEIVATIPIQTQIWNLNSIYIKNWSNLIEIG